MSGEVRVSKEYDYGFFLNEQELRRIHDIMLQQMQVIRPNDTINLEITVTFKNDIQEVKETIDDILAETNGDLWEIKKLKFDMTVSGGNSPSRNIRIDIEFNKEFFFNPITCSLSADDRNWVYLTLSKLEERFKAIKRLRIKYFIIIMSLTLLGFLDIFVLITFIVIIFSPKQTGIVLPIWMAALGLAVLTLINVSIVV